MRLRKGLRGCLFCLAAVTVLIMAVACSPSSEGNKPTAPPTVEQPVSEQGPPSVETGESGTGTDSGNLSDAEDEEETATGDEESEASAENMNGSAGQLYAITFEAMMELDEGLNHEMNYIAVDLSEMSQLTEDDKTYIIEYLQDFGTEIRDRTLDQLMEEENPEQSSPSLKGVLLRVDKVEINEDSAQIEGSKYRSGTGVVGAKITLKLEEGAWKLSGSEMTWIS